MVHIQKTPKSADCQLKFGILPKAPVPISRIQWEACAERCWKIRLHETSLLGEFVLLFQKNVVYSPCKLDASDIKKNHGISVGRLHTPFLDIVHQQKSINLSKSGLPLTFSWPLSNDQARDASASASQSQVRLLVGHPTGVSRSTNCLRKKDGNFPPHLGLTFPPFFCQSIRKYPNLSWMRKIVPLDQ